MILNIPSEWLNVRWEDLTSNDGFRRGPFGGNLKKAFFVAQGYSIYEQYSPINDDCTTFRYFIDEKKYQELSSFRVEDGDFLISCSGTMGRITQVPIGAPKGVINQALLRIRLVEGKIEPKYFLKLFRSPLIQESVLTKSGGGAIQNLAPVKELKEISFPIPPLAEQKVIADKLDELLAEVESTKARLDAIPAILKSFRQSVLAAAVSGKLTEEWRGGIERNWQQKTIGDLAVVSTGKTPKRTEQKYWDKPSIPWLTSAVTGSAYCSEADQFVTDIAVSECKLKLFIPGTLLLAMYGEGKTRGQVTELKIEATCNQACAAISVNNELSLTAFLKLRLQENYEETRKAASGGNQPNLNLNKVRDIPIELPSIEEQTEIVRRVEELFAFADKVESQVNAAQERVNNLTQSILAKAFRGELTADWRAANPELITGENSAEVLLERIKAEREALALASKAAKKKPSKKIRAKKVVGKESHNTSINRNLSPVQSVIADGVAHNPQDIFNKLTPDLSLTEVFNEISELLRDDKIEEKTVDGITGFFIK